MKGKRGRKGLMILKLDLEKAYDRVEWEFLQSVLKAFKFPEVFIKMVMECISSSRVSVLLNGGRQTVFPIPGLTLRRPHLAVPLPHLYGISYNSNRRGGSEWKLERN